MGRLTRDVEMRYTPKGTPLADIGLAVNYASSDESGKKQEQVTFFEITVWGKQAELAQRYLSRGSPLFVEGRLQLDTWEDKQTRQKKSKLRIVAENLQLIGSRPATDTPPREPREALSSTRRPAPSEPDPDWTA